jgi:hypothetical protein
MAYEKCLILLKSGVRHSTSLSIRLIFCIITNAIYLEVFICADVIILR